MIGTPTFSVLSATTTFLFSSQLPFQKLLTTGTFTGTDFVSEMHRSICFVRPIIRRRQRTVNTIGDGRRRADFRVSPLFGIDSSINEPTFDFRREFTSSLTERTERCSVTWTPEDAAKVLSLPPSSEWTYRVSKTYDYIVDEPPNEKNDDDDEDVGAESRLARILHRSDVRRYPSVSQARKACRLGRVIVARRTTTTKRSVVEQTFPTTTTTIKNGSSYLLFVGRSDTVLRTGDAILAIERDPCVSSYPPSVTGHARPPDALLRRRSDNGNEDDDEEDEACSPIVLYQDDRLAVVRKPAPMSTIRSVGPKDGGGDREDLQSCLPWILSPPPLLSQDATTTRTTTPPVPRPVHRLDRRTMGLVVAAKTDDARRRLSRAFADRAVAKTYTALVLGDPESGNGSSSSSSSSSSSRWRRINYPVDGKEAVTDWRVVDRSRRDDDDDDLLRSRCLSLLECRPRTGRYHQIRRHLAYCLGTPIVGDAKYDGGGVAARSLRTTMFLCATEVEFPYPVADNEDEKDVLSRVFAGRRRDGDGVVRDDAEERSSSGRVWRLRHRRQTDKGADDDDNNTGSVLDEADPSAILTMRVSIPIPKMFRDMIAQHQNNEL